MTKDEAVRLIEETFKNPFDEDRFRLFAKNLLNGLDESKEVAFDYYGQYILDAYKGHVKRYKRIGKYIDTEGSELDVLIVNLEKETALDQARTMQRNFIASYLKKRGEKDAALVAFHTDGLEDWRFSFVRMDYRRVERKGKLKLQVDLTPARRYSFLVGRNEPNHTARQQLLPIMQDDRRNPVLSEIESAFNIESVTNEFFEKYKGLFLKVEEELEGLIASDQKIKRDFASKKIAVADFAKKLLGQIVFLYFLQKKGWLGVEKDETGNFKGWGTGPKNFLRRLFDKKIVPYENFFNNLLEPLFYEALAIDRGVASFYSPFKCKIPFLNGGLFEPIGGYNWQETDILLKNDTFGEIFDTFDLFNFTVREDEPLEKEVAVDPEMLGKVFENLLEVKDRRSKGTFYTPREIVHYMCQESLINYLDAAVNIKQEGIIAQKPVQKKLLGEPDPEQLGFTAGTYYSVIPLKDIEFFIRLGVFCIENDIAKESGTTSYSYKLPESIRTNAGLLDNALSNIKICDPAIGSGAFPVGMLHEIVTARRVLTAYIGEFQERTRYNFKRHAIQESIYGVDIEVSAVDIAKLRLWLSLVVDEDDFETIKPLPNLDYKIVSGNSLFGVKKDLLNDHLFKELERLKWQFFDETNPRKKKEEKEKIDNLISQITHGDTHFDFEIYFSEIFHQKSGFDVVIGNPPWGSKLSKEEKVELKAAYQSIDSSTPNSFAYFIGVANKIARGGFAFVLPDSLLIKDYAKTRALISGTLSELHWYQNIGVPEYFRPFRNVEHDVCFIITKQNDVSVALFVTNFYDPTSLALKRKFSQVTKKQVIRPEFDYAFNMTLQDADYSILEKINRLPALDTILQCHEGIHTGNCREVLFVEKPKNKWCKPLYYGGGAGDQIRNYVSKRAGWWVDYRKEIVDTRQGFYASLRDENIFCLPKIYITRTGNPFKAFLDDETYASNNFFSLQYKDYSKNSVTSLKAILPFIVSPLSQYFIRRFAAPRLGNTFVETKIKHLLKFKVPVLDVIQTRELIGKVDSIIKILDGDLSADITELQVTINRMIYGFYGFTEDEIVVIESFV